MSDWVPLPSTVWTAIAQARTGAPALDALLRKYYPPVHSIARSAGLSPEDADDVTQEVFLKLVRDDIVARADPAKGRFRGLLLSVARQVIADRRRFASRTKRGGATKTVPLEVDPAADTDPEFDHAWIRNLVRVGMNELRLECERDGTPYFRALLMVAEEELGYAEIATRLAVPLAQVKNFVHQARVRLRSHVLKEIQQYAASREEYDAEVSHLMRFVQ